MGATTIAGALTLSTIANATGNFLVEASGVVKKRTPAETLTDIGAQASGNYITGTGSLSAQDLTDIGNLSGTNTGDGTYGIANTNYVKIDSASVADDEYARFTANGLESRSTSEVLSDIGGAALTGSSNNTITTVTGANAIQGEDHLTFDGSDLKVLEDVNDGNPSLSIGGADAEKLLIQSVFDSGAQTLDFVKFSTATASATADKGKYIFDVDGTTIATIDDGGIDLASGKAFTVNGSAISGGGGAITALNNATENELVTVGATTTELDAESFLTFNATDSTLTIKSEDVDGATDPSLKLIRDSGSPANDDNLGEIEFYGRNASDDADIDYVSIHARSVNISNTMSAKESALYFSYYLKDPNLATQTTNVLFGSEEIIFNNNGHDLDFRVESDDEEYMFFVDANNNRVSIGDSEDAPAATLEITNHATTGASGVPLLQLNNNDTDEFAVDINAANITEDVMIITADALTSGHVINISADALTTGTMFLLHSDSADTNTRDLLHIHNDHASATGTTALDVQNDSTGPVAKFEGNGALLAKVGLPETVAASSGSNIDVYAGISGRATTIVLGANTTYTATTSDSGVVIVLTTTTSKVVLPDIPTDATIGVQFTIINAGGGTISDGITTGDTGNCKVNGSVPSSGQVSIADNETFTFIQFTGDEWHKIG